MTNHPCEVEGCPNEATEFFAFNDDEGLNCCMTHYDDLLDSLGPATPDPRFEVTYPEGDTDG